LYRTPKRGIKTGPIADGESKNLRSTGSNKQATQSWTAEKNTQKKKKTKHKKKKRTPEKKRNITEEGQGDSEYRDIQPTPKRPRLKRDNLKKALT